MSEQFPGRWRNIDLSLNVSITARDSSHLHTNASHYDCSPEFNYRVEFLDDTSRNSWVIPWAGGIDRHLGLWDASYLQLVTEFNANGDPIDARQMVQDGFCFYEQPYPIRGDFEYWRKLMFPTSIEASTFLPENQRLRLTIFFDYVRFYNSPDTMRFGEASLNFWGSFAYGGPDSGMTWATESDYFNYLPDRQQASIEFFIEREVPESTGDLAFTGYVYPNGDNAYDWYPTDTTKTVGLVFQFTPGIVGRIGYHVSDISTWQGISMNYPLQATKPTANDSDRFFDIRIGDVEKYHIQIRNFDWNPWEEFEGLPQDMYDLHTPLSIRAYDLQVKEDVNVDTLWIVAQDYAAHATVTVWGGTPSGETPARLMDTTTTAWGDTTFAISVPRDNDGFWHYRYNIGDFMADRWEEEVLGDVSGGLKPRDFYPFCDQIDNTFIASEMADNDTIPDGRGWDGDRFTNFEEYRGFRIAGDKDGYYIGLKHQRLDPFRKEVFIRFMPDVEREVMRGAPGYIYEHDLDIYLTTIIADSTGEPIVLDTTARRSQVRYVSFNQWGAWYPYFSFPMITNRPFSFRENALTFWSAIEKEYEWLDVEPDERRYKLGICLAEGAGEDSTWTIPEETSRLIVFYPSIMVHKDSSYYSGPDSIYWKSDARIVIRHLMAHEVGHATGMPDTTCNYIMGGVGVDSLTLQFQVDATYFTPEYTPGSLSKITLRRDN